MNIDEDSRIIQKAYQPKEYTLQELPECGWLGVCEDELCDFEFVHAAVLDQSYNFEQE